MGTRRFPGKIWPGYGADHPSPPSAKVKERVQLYLHTPFEPSWPVLGLTSLYFRALRKFIVFWNEFVIQNTMQVPYGMWYHAVWYKGNKCCEGNKRLHLLGRILSCMEEKGQQTEKGGMESRLWESQWWLDGHKKGQNKVWNIGHNIPWSIKDIDIFMSLFWH